MTVACEGRRWLVGVAALVITFALCACAGPDVDSDADVGGDADSGVALDTGAAPDSDTDAGASTDAADGLAETQAAPTWTTVHEELPGALLSIWGLSSADIWTVGADRKDGKGPLVMRGDGSSWATLETGATGHLWSVYSAQPGTVWMVGTNGKILRYDVATQVFTALASPTDATLYGVWGASDGPMWSVGGYLGGLKPGVVVRIDGDTATKVTDLPELAATNGLLFKVWGPTADDVWVAGDDGTLLHFDGKTWTATTLPGEPRLVTVHGSGPDDIAVVGGWASSVVFERRDGGDWVEVSPVVQGPPLAGVFVRDGMAIATGMAGAVLARGGDGWDWLPFPPTDLDFHACWIDSAGGYWFVGGALGSLTAMNHGVMLRYAP